MRVLSDNLSEIPRYVRVGPYRYQVYVQQDRLPADRVAQILYEPLVMNVRPAMAHDRQVEGLLHEVLHAVWEVVLTTDDQATFKQEEVIERLSPHLLAVLRDNPDLVAYLTDPRDVP